MNPFYVTLPVVIAGVILALSIIWCTKLVLGLIIDRCTKRKKGDS